MQGFFVLKIGITLKFLKNILQEILSSLCNILFI